MIKSIIFKGVVTVVVLVGVGMGVLALVNYAQAKQRDVERLNDIRLIRMGLEAYFFNRQSYPIASQPVALGDDDTRVLCESAYGLQADSESFDEIFVSTVPADPLAARGQHYYYASNGETYVITFQLERADSGLVAGQHQATPEGIE